MGIEVLIDGITKVIQPCESYLCSAGDFCCDAIPLKESVEKFLASIQFTDFKVKKSGVHPNEFFLQAHLLVAGTLLVERNPGCMIKVGSEVNIFSLNIDPLTAADKFILCLG